MSQFERHDSSPMDKTPTGLSINPQHSPFFPEHPLSGISYQDILEPRVPDFNALKGKELAWKLPVDLSDVESLDITDIDPDTGEQIEAHVFEAKDVFAQLSPDQREKLTAQDPKALNRDGVVVFTLVSPSEEPETTTQELEADSEPKPKAVSTPETPKARNKEQSDLTLKEKAGLALLAAGLSIAAIPAFTAKASGTAGGEAPLTFPETGKSIQGKFAEYWQTHGGLAQQGYPISQEMAEVSDTDGKTYTVQYFERAVFELHPENKAPYDVLLSLLGSMQYKQKYGTTGAPGQRANPDPSAQLFPETGKHMGGRFAEYWKTNGGLAQQGYPISEEFQEKSDLNGQTYTVQYFERGVFELHPENQAPNDVLLSQLGTFRYKLKTEPKPTPTPVATEAPKTYYGFQEIGVPQDDGKDHRAIDTSKYARTDFRNQTGMEDSLVTYAATVYLGANVISVGSDFKYNGTIYHSYVVEYQDNEGVHRLNLMAVSINPGNKEVKGSAVGLVPRDKLLTTGDPKKKVVESADIIINQNPSTQISIGTQTPRYDIVVGDDVAFLLTNEKGEDINLNDPTERARISKSTSPLFSPMILIGK